MLMLSKPGSLVVITVLADYADTSLYLTNL